MTMTMHAKERPWQPLKKVSKTYMFDPELFYPTPEKIY
jgi:hypothetical protein